MLVRELIKKLQKMEQQLGNEKVVIYSEDYCCDLHNVQKVTDGYFDGWNNKSDVIGICITK